MPQEDDRMQTSLMQAKAYNEGKAYKRLVICCDGTWLDSTSLQNGKLVPPSNVTRLTHAIRSFSGEGIQQIVYYQAGVGSTGTLFNRFVGGSIGAGLADNVREAYAFICNNYFEGDEIFLIGFSRGAFTARSVAGLICNIGVLTKKGLPSFPVIYKDFAHRDDKRYMSAEPDIPFPDKSRFRKENYASELHRRGLSRLGVHVKAIGVFDTVGSLGIPRISWLGRLGQSSSSLHEYAFYDTTLDKGIDNAFQALALDERRADFTPALWERRGNLHTRLVQVWFPGVHANVGGGYDDQELANISLAWMMAMLGPLLSIDMKYILQQDKMNVNYYRTRHMEPRPWSFGKIYNSVTGAFLVAGEVTRTPGSYHRSDPRTGEYTRRLLEDTNEYIHASVRTRFVLRGPGYADRGDYDPKALRVWRLMSKQTSNAQETQFFWENEDNGYGLLPEAPLRAVEKMLLHASPQSEDYIEESAAVKRNNYR